MQGSYKDKAREIINALRTFPRWQENWMDGYPTKAKQPYRDEPEGSIYVGLSHTLALEWANVLEALLDGKD